MEDIPKVDLNKEFQQNIFDNIDDDEEKKIKKKLLHLFRDRKKVEQLYEKLGKEEICQIFNFDFKINEKNENKKYIENNRNINLENHNNNDNTLKHGAIREIFLERNEIF